MAIRHSPQVGQYLRVQRHDPLLRSLSVADPDEPLRLDEVVSVQAGDLLDPEARERCQREHGAHLRGRRPDGQLEVLSVDRPGQHSALLRPHDGPRRVRIGETLVHRPLVEAVQVGDPVVARPRVQLPELAGPSIVEELLDVGASRTDHCGGFDPAGEGPQACPLTTFTQLHLKTQAIVGSLKRHAPPTGVEQAQGAAYRDARESKERRDLCWEATILIFTVQPMMANELQGEIHPLPSNEDIQATVANEEAARTAAG